MFWIRDICMPTRKEVRFWPLADILMALMNVSF